MSGGGSTTELPSMTGSTNPMVDPYFGNFTADQSAGPLSNASDGGGINWSSLSKSLGEIGKDLKTASGSGATQQQAAINQARSQIGQPSAPVNLGSLVQALMEKQNQYFPGTTNKQPVSLGRTKGGLLGM